MTPNDELYMRRCIQLAKNGRQTTEPNPMVGAVIVHDGRIIGEGYHIRPGGPHAEVNAFASVRKEDEHLLPESTIYVSLEPCSHWGKTPPCAELLIRKKIRRCVVGCQDPFAKVQGRGIQMLRDAGIEVTVGVLEEECLQLNSHFVTFHRKKRPYTTLKWAQSANGFIDGKISNYYTQALCHKRRAEHQAIMVGNRTWNIDHPRLDVRCWYGENPKVYVAHGGVPEIVEPSLLVEGGATLHQYYIDNVLWDDCFVEIAPFDIEGKVKAPTLKNAVLVEETKIAERTIRHYRPLWSESEIK